MVRIYTKKPGCPPDFEDPIILKRGSDVKKVCFTLHRDLPDQFKYALVWTINKGGLILWGIFNWFSQKRCKITDSELQTLG